jgi:predicted nucleotidyltransferase
LTGIEGVFKQAAADLEAVGAKWAVIGGLAVATRATPRFTQDVDFAVSVADDSEAETIVHRLQIRGYAVGMMLEQDYANRLATVRLIRPVLGSSQVFVDLLFASSGIEDQIVARADRLEMWPGCRVPVANVGHLVALKLLSRDDRRLQDQLDLQALLAVATQADLDEARQAAAMIVARGFHRGRDLPKDLDDLVREERP